MVACALQSWVMVTRVRHVECHVNQGGAHQLVFAHGDIYCDSGSSVDGGGLVSIKEVWQEMGELDKEGEVQACAICLLRIFQVTIPRVSCHLLCHLL